MTVSSTTSRKEYTGDGVTTSFATSPLIFDASSTLAVYAVVTATGVSTTLTENTHYTVSGGSGSTGTVNLAGGTSPYGAPAGTTTLVIVRTEPLTQASDFVQNDPSDAEVVESALDKLTRITQQLDADNDRAFRLAQTDVSGASTTLPTPEASTIIGWDSAGTALQNYAAGDITEVLVTPFMETVLDDTTAAAARTTLGATSIGESLFTAADAATVRTAANAMRQPCVTMIRTANSTNDTVTSAAWKVYDENGTAIDTTGTTSEGLQEAINYAARYGYDLRVFGGGLKPAYFGQTYGGALGADPFATTNGSAVVTVTHTAHGRITGDKMTFNGLSGAVNNIPASEFAAEHTITKISDNSYSVTLTTNANATSSGGGANCRWQDSGQDVAIISCTEGIDVPPIQGVDWEIHATINFGGSDAGPAISFDSVMASEIKITDQIVCASTYLVGVQFKPTNELPQDPNGPVVTSSRFYLPSIVMTAPTGTCVSLDATNGDVADNVFDVIEPNGGAYGVRSVFAASHGVRGNAIRVNGAHDQTSAMVSAGLSATGASNSYGNQWQITGHPATGCVGLDVWGVNDYFEISTDSALGTPAAGIKLESSAAQNRIVAHKVTGTLLVQDAATVKTNVVHTPRSCVRAHKNGTNQTGVATATFTDVTFGTEIDDTLGEFGGTTFTATYPGLYIISANVAWVSAVDGTLLATRLVATPGNADQYNYASSAGGSQGVLITAVMRLASGDTVKVQARQDSGGNQDISGTAASTWLTIAKLDG